ncbi:MAG: hypothetical protein K9I34_02695 [Bacteroidales bacterium]|nr:hypothetical protein [Bacteroidales bacterium]
MNTQTFNWKYKWLLVLTGISLFFPGFAQSTSESIVRTGKITSDCAVYMDSPGVSSEIISWAQNEIKVEYSLLIEGKTPQDKTQFLAAFTKQLENQLKEAINGRVQASVRMQEINQNNSSIRIRLKDDPKEYKLSKFEGSLKIWVPATVLLHVSSNFNAVNVGNFTNDVYIDINSADFKLSSCKKLMAKMNFAGNSTAGKVEMADIDCNSSTITIQQILQDVSLNANFSTISIVKIGNKANLNLNSSSFETGDLVSLNLNGNFVRKCKVNQVETAQIEINSSDFTANRVKNLKLQGANFSTLHLIEVSDLSILESSSSNFNITKLGTLKASEASFCNFKIGTLTTSLVLTASSGDLSIDNVLPGFKNLDIKGTFLSMNIKLSPTAEYTLFADLTFPDYDFGTLSLNKEKDGMNHEIIRGTKGTAKASSSQINIACQSCDLKLK